MSEGGVLALSGGVGGAKLALGLARVLPAGRLTVVANTGDDFEHLGLSISPDIDTLVYALAGLDNPETGWGRRDETWSFMATLAELGAETWFRLGDRDLAMHVERTRLLRAGELLSAVTARIAHSLGIETRILPMSDDPVRTRVVTQDHEINFQDYFVRLKCAPPVRAFVFAGAASARPHPDFLTALHDRSLRAIVICPSNPFISIGPILAVPGVRQALADAPAPVIAVSPIVGGDAVKGPTAKMMRELGLTVDVAAVAHLYGDIIDGYVVDERDGADAAGLQVPVRVTQTLMRDLADREHLARAVLAFADELTAEGHARASGANR